MAILFAKRLNQYGLQFILLPSLSFVILENLDIDLFCFYFTLNTKLILLYHFSNMLYISTHILFLSVPDIGVLPECVSVWVPDFMKLEL